MWRGHFSAFRGRVQRGGLGLNMRSAMAPTVWRLFRGSIIYDLRLSSEQEKGHR
jgi:hypothetical protein